MLCDGCDTEVDKVFADNGALVCIECIKRANDDASPEKDNPEKENDDA